MLSVWPVGSAMITYERRLSCDIYVRREDLYAVTSVTQTSPPKCVASVTSNVYIITRDVADHQWWSEMWYDTITMSVFYLIT